MRRVRYSKALVGGTNIGLAHNLNQRRAAAVEVDIGFQRGIGKAIVQTFAGILFQMQARDADPFLCRPVKGPRYIRLPRSACRTARSGSPWASRDRSSSCVRRRNVRGCGSGSPLRRAQRTRLHSGSAPATLRANQDTPGRPAYWVRCRNAWSSRRMPSCW